MSGTKSNTKLFVGGLPYQLRGRDLREIFSEYGEVVFARVILDRDTKRSKGFWFVEFASAEDALRAKEELDWAEINGRTIKVDYAFEKPQQEGSTQTA